MIRKLQRIIRNNKKEVVVSSFLILVLSIFFIGNAFASLTPTKSVIITSQNTNYDNKDAGSWKVEKSSKWIGKGRARVSFNVDTTAMPKSKNTDVVMVIDVSDSMSGNKLENVKQSSTELIETLLSNSNNNVSLVSFANSSNILSSFTNDKDTLINEINNLQSGGSTNYYQALKGVDTILKDYVKKDNTDVIVLFLTGGYPNTDTPNQIAQYRYLKDAYSYITINAIQYGFGKEILNTIKEVSDRQFLANNNTLSTVLTDACVIPVKYEEFQLVDYIDNQYFTLSSEDDITVSKGQVTLEYEKAKQKIIWTIDNLKSGEEVKLTMDINLNKEFIGAGGVYSTNEKVEITTKIGDKLENVSSTQTPALAESYKVTYEGNAPEGASVTNVPDESSYSVFETATISTEEPTCTGYEFKGWEIVTENVTRVGDGYFIMPEKDVVLRAKWSKVAIAKSMDGTVSTQGEPVMKGQDWWNSDFEKEKVTSIEVKTSTAIPETAIAYWDASKVQDKSVVAYIEDDGNGNYKVSIGGLGGVIANSDCSSLFEEFFNVKIILLDNFDTSNVTNMSNMFRNCNSLESLNLSKFNTSKVTNMFYMFNVCSSLTSLDLSSFDTSKVTNMYGMVRTCKNLSYINLSSFDTSNVTNMSLMFAETSIVDLNLSNFNTSKVTNMSAMFWNCSSLINLVIGNFNTSKVTNMGSMFGFCNNLTSINLSDFDTSNVTSMNSMFQNCSNLTTLNLIGFNTSKVTNMSFMFNGCTGLKDLDLNNFDTSSVTNMNSMFNGCSSLTSLDLSHFDTSSVTNMNYMFNGCSSLTSLDLSHFDTSNVVSMNSMFNVCMGLINLNLNNFNTSNVTNMGSMFNGCANLINLNISNFNTSKVTNMSYMFYHCYNLVYLDVSHFDTSEVINMQGMFGSCTSLTELNLSNFDTSKVTLMGDDKGYDYGGMFQGCSNLTQLDVSNFDTSNVTSMALMFKDCKNLIDLDFENFDTVNVTNMRSMFSGCSSLTSLNLNNFNTSKVTIMADMFYGCRKLESLDVSAFDTSKVTDMSSMFNNCSSLIGLDVSNFDTVNVTNMRYMFAVCSSLTSLDLSNFNTPNVTNMIYMFYECGNLVNLDMRNAEFSNVAYSQIFWGVNNGVSIIVKDTTAQSWIRSRLNEANKPNATVTIAPETEVKVEADNDTSVNDEDTNIVDNSMSIIDNSTNDISFRLDDSSITFGFKLLPLRYGVRFNQFGWL